MNEEKPIIAREKLAAKNGRFFDAPLGLIAAAGVHVALFFALFYVFQWNTDSEAVYAELWAPEDASGRNIRGQSSETTDEMPPEPEMNQAPELADAKEAIAEPEPAPAPVPSPTPEPAPAPEPQPASEPASKATQPQPEPEAAKEADIRLAREQALKKEQEEAERKLREEEAKRTEEARLAEEKRLEEQRLAQEKRAAEEARKKREKARQARIAEQMRQAELARITGAPVVDRGRAGSTAGDPNAVRQNLRGSLSAAYTARVIACIRPRIAFNVPANAKRGNNVATFEVNLLPNGEVVNTKMVKSSGLPAFDAAVDRAIARCNPFPRPTDGTPIPRRMQILFDPVDSK